MADIRVLIADDHLVVREGLRTILEVADGFQVVGEATDGAEAVQQVDALQPDVVLMDLRMPGVDGITAIQQIKAQWPRVEVVILTTYDDDQYIVQGLRAGARGYLLKDTDRQTLYVAIRAAARGESLLPPAVADRVVASLASPLPPSPLSDRERQVLALMVDGKRNKEIAERLVITERTVKAHVTSIFNKLDVNSRAEAIAVALRTGLRPGEAQDEAL